MTNRGRNDNRHGMTLTDFGANHIESLRRSRVLDTAHASDRIERIAVEFSQLPVSVCDVDRNDLPDHEAAASGGRREIENLIELALEADRRFRDSRRLHDLRRRVIDVGMLEIGDGSVVFTAGRIHRCGARSPGANASSGGSTQTQLKNENGARFGWPEPLRVETQAIGRGATALRMSPYKSE